MDYMSTNHGNIAYHYEPSTNKDAKNLILLTCLGGSSAYYDFHTISSKIKGKNNILSIDYLGYGFSDLTQTPRTIDNIVEELHEVIQKIYGDQGLVFFVHSIAGVYSQYYVQKYQPKLQAFIGIEPTIPKFALENSESLEELSENKNIAATLKEYRKTGLIEEVNFGINPYLSDFDKMNCQKMSRKMLLNDTVIDELDRTIDNLTLASKEDIGKECPSLLFESFTQKGNYTHSCYMNQRKHSKEVFLKGSHYLHWEHPERISNEVLLFLDKL